LLLPDAPSADTPRPSTDHPAPSTYDRDPALPLEADAYGAWFARLLDRRIPPVLWRSYASACLALADGLTGGYADALDALVRAASSERVTGDG
jgi:hypothetical protein